MIEIIVGVVSAIVLALVGLLGISRKQLRNARKEREAYKADSENATELANTQSDLSRAQNEARTKANEDINHDRDDGMFGDSRLQHKD